LLSDDGELSRVYDPKSVIVRHRPTGGKTPHLSLPSKQHAKSTQQHTAPTFKTQQQPPPPNNREVVKIAPTTLSNTITMVLYVIGLGLGDEKDVTVRGLELVKAADHVFLEAYTSILGGVSQERLEAFYGKKVTVADRGLVENEAEDLIIQPAKEQNVAFLVVGDPVCATTHTDLILRAKEVGVKVELVHNASIMGAAGACGLQLYNFGQTVSIPFFDENWRPTSFYPRIQYNRKGGLHTLCLLDIKVKEPDFVAMMKGRTEFLPPRYMSVSVAAEQLLEAEATHGENVYEGTKTLCVGLARMGQPTQKMVAGTLKDLTKVDMGEPLHSLIICGDLHDLELEVLKEFIVEGSTYELENSAKSDSKTNDGDSYDKES
jgi:diphthine synthase